MSNVYWLNAISGSFTNPADWSGGVVPGRTDTAILNAAGEPYTVTYDSTEGYDVGGLQLASNATLRIENGELFAGTVGGAGVNNAGTILVNTTFGTTGVCDNSGVVLISGDAGQPAQVFIMGYGTLTGGGDVTLSDDANNMLECSDRFYNVDNIISGAGTIEITGLVNEIAGVIDANGQYSMTINSSGYIVVNAGTIESTGSGGLLLKSRVDNEGVLSVSRGTLKITRAVSGAGVAVIGGGKLDLRSRFDEAVTFTGGGRLELARSQDFHNTITGFSTKGATVLDLDDVGFVKAGEATFSGSKKGGVLTVTDGTHTARLMLEGNFLGSTFVASSDGHGGTDVTAEKTQTAAAPPHAMISAMAAFGASPVSHAPLGGTPAVRETLLTSPRVAIA